MPAAPDAPPRVLSPNSVLANALLRSIDMIRPKVVASRPGRIADPKHFYRSFTTTELGALMAQRPADLVTRERAREMPIYKRYFDLIASGGKTIEVRVAYPSNKRLAAGQLLKFTCRGEECLTRITKIARYPTFDDMFDHEDPVAVNPAATRDEQLASIRLIYPAEKEALGVIAIHVQRA